MSLLFPAYLLGFLGLALPWILHRFSDHQPPEKLFPSKRFLESTTPPVSRKRLLRYRALFALRVLSLMLLCFLFAQPWIANTILASDQQRHHMVVVDQSLSMRVGDRWESAMVLAQQTIDEIGNESATLIAFDHQVTVVATTEPSDTADPVSLADALDELEPGYTRGDYGILMQRVDRLASEKEVPVKLWLISDAQRSSLPAQLNALYAPNVDELALQSVDTSGEVNVHLVADAQSADGATARVSASLLASVSDDVSDDVSDEPIERTVEVRSADGVLDSREISLTPGELSVLQFDGVNLPAQSNPEFQVVVTQSDALPDDNMQVIPITQDQATGVVLLRSPGSSGNNAPIFLTTALQSDGIASVESVTGNAQQLSPDSTHLIAGRDLVEPLALDVLQFVDGGNNALVFNQAASSGANDLRVEGVGVGGMDEAHPLALGNISWFGAQFYDLPQLEPQNDDKVLIRTAEGQVLLLERPTARGRLLILNDPLDGSASNLPLQPAFVGLMQAIVSYFDANTTVPATTVVGQRLALPANVQLFDMEGRTLVELADRASASSTEISEPGIYTVVSGRGEQRLRAVLDAQEADISLLGSAQTQAWLDRYVRDDNDAQVQSESDPLPRSQLEEDVQQQSLWQWLLPIVALLLFSEGWFANRRLDVRRDGS